MDTIRGPVGRVEPTPECAEPLAGSLDCLAAMAEGYINASDLCGPCTTRLMTAVDWVTGRSNAWHTNWQQRAGGAS